MDSKSLRQERTFVLYKVFSTSKLLKSILETKHCIRLRNDSDLKICAIYEVFHRLGKAPDATDKLKM